MLALAFMLFLSYYAAQNILAQICLGNENSMYSKEAPVQRSEERTILQGSMSQDVQHSFEPRVSIVKLIFRDVAGALVALVTAEVRNHCDDGLAFQLRLLFLFRWSLLLWRIQLIPLRALLIFTSMYTVTTNTTNTITITTTTKIIIVTTITH